MEFVASLSVRSATLSLSLFLCPVSLPQQRTFLYIYPIIFFSVLLFANSVVSGCGFISHIFGLLLFVTDMRCQSHIVSHIRTLHVSDTLRFILCMMDVPVTAILLTLSLLYCGWSDCLIVDSLTAWLLTVWLLSFGWCDCHNIGWYGCYVMDGVNAIYCMEWQPCWWWCDHHIMDSVIVILWIRWLLKCVWCDGQLVWMPYCD